MPGGVPLRRAARACVALLLSLATLLAAPAHGQGTPERFRDPEDGRLDLSDYLLNQKGLLPIPIIITEPAVGYGGGLMLAYFSQSIAERAQQGGKFIPPTIMMGGGFYASSRSYGGVAGIFRPVRRDRFRVLAALGATSLNLDFFGFDPEGPLEDDPIPYHLDMLFGFARGQARIRTSPFFLGAHYTFLGTETSVDATLPAEIPPRDLRTDVAGVGLGVEFDTRNNFLYATRGMDINVNGTWYGPAVGGDETFSKYAVQGLFYGQATERWGYGLRFDMGFSSGDIPFFMKPSLSMRGLTAGKYLSDVAALGEVEGRYSLDSRWTVLAFTGGGRVAEQVSDLGSAAGVWAGGAGFRYLMARQLGLASGVDLAVGPGGEFAIYLQAGSAWR